MPLTLMHVFRSFLLGLSCLAILTGCPKTPGNGEGYTGAPRQFYRIDPTHTCFGQPEPVREVLTLSEEGNALRFDGCTNEPLEVSPEVEIDVSFDENLVGYEAGIYELRSNRPTSDSLVEYKEAWCIGSGGNNELFVDGNKLTNEFFVQIFERTQPQWQLRYEGDVSFEKKLESYFNYIVRSFEPTPIFQARIHVDPDAVENNQFYTEVRLSVPGQPVAETNGHCRLLQ